MRRDLLLCAFALVCLAVLSLPSAVRAASQIEAQEALELAVPAHLQKVARTLRPSADKPEVRREGDGFVAVYQEVDSRRPEVDVTPAEQPGDYVGRVSYVIHEFHARGKTEAAALKGPFRKAKSKRMREYTSFKGGKWAL